MNSRPSIIPAPAKLPNNRPKRRQDRTFEARLERQIVRKEEPRERRNPRKAGEGTR
jgi:hypothetical protein